MHLREKKNVIEQIEFTLSIVIKSIKSMLSVTED